MKLITQCASRKTVSNTPKTEMVNFNHINNVEERVELWLESLNKQPQITTTWDLYTGHYYKILNNILPTDIEKSIISTGYGVLYESDIVTDYMVTYASHIDKPTKINQLKGVNYRDWHNTLCKKRNTLPLVDWVNKDDIVIILLGQDYLKVTQEDLLDVYNKLSDKNNFIVISSSKTSLLPNTLPIDASWRKWLGGPQNVMGPNILGKILKDNLPLNFKKLNKHFLEVYKPLAEKSNVKYKDEFFIDYIKSNPLKSQGQLIKELRGKNISISTGRMARLYIYNRDI